MEKKRGKSSKGKETGKENLNSSLVGGEDEDKKSAEFLWREFLETNNNLAYVRDADHRPILYHWGGRGQPLHWVHIAQHELEEMADRVLSSLVKGSYRNSTLVSCASLVDKALPNMRPPLKQCRRMTRLATKNAVLFFHDDGKIEARQINRFGVYTLAYDDGHSCRDILFDAYIPVDIDFSRVDSQGWYTPRSRDETEAGLWGGLVRSMFADEEDLRNFQEFFGDLFSKKQRKAIPILVGPADSGKSQLLIVLRRMISQHAMVDLTEIDGFNKETWVGKSVLIVDEGPTSLGVKAESTVKRLVGGAGTTVQRKREKSLHLDATWKHIWAFNSMLKFVEKSEAMRTRMRPFVVQKFTGKPQGELGEKICAKELDLAFDWALEGLVRVEERGRVLRSDELSERSRSVLEETREETNPAIVWVRETELVPSSSKTIAISDLHRMYRDWAEENGHRFHAGVSLPVFVRDYLSQAMAHLYPDTWSDKKVRKTNKRTHNRENHFRVEFRNNHAAQAYESLHFDEDSRNVEQMPARELRVVQGNDDPFQ